MTSRTTSKDASDAKRWLIIGAHQAGASEKRVARISGLSKTAVRHIILNYQRTGDPCLPKREPKKVKEKLLVEYDENGNLILSDDEAEEDEEDLAIQQKKILAKNNNKKENSISKRRNSKLNSKVTAKDLIHFMMDQVKRVEHDITPIPTSADDQVQQEQQQQQPQYYQQHHTWCPTPPRDGSISNTCTVESPNPKHHHLPLPDSPSFLPLSPPSTTTSGPKSTLTLSDDMDDTNDDHSSCFEPPRQTTPPITTPGKYDQTIRGYELWTEKDDMLLLQHVLSKLQVGNWRELESKFDGRHTARLCTSRWNYLRNHLLKGIAQADSTPW
ncbi:hypothetical protein BC941DRAFT_431826 [Chlamydoabsidia padenii]|nr:hypothetical protein BC941DRAFT_431826 [Chlamydoabsidia padenii]